MAKFWILFFFVIHAVTTLPTPEIFENTGKVSLDSWNIAVVLSLKIQFFFNLETANQSLLQMFKE